MKVRKYLSILLTVCLLCTYSTNVFAHGEEEKVKVVVTVKGVKDDVEVPVLFEKAGEGEEPGVSITSKTESHVVEFPTLPGGSCVVTGLDVPGYIKPAKPVTIELKKFQGNFVKYATLTYEAADVDVTEISINEKKISVIKDYSHKLVASITPPYASNTNITWESKDPSIATVDANGNVTGVKTGTTTITASVAANDEDGAEVFTDTCDVTVASIKSMVDITTDPISMGEVLELPDTIPVMLDNGNEVNVPVTWKAPAVSNNGAQMVSYDSAGTKNLVGDVLGTDLTATLPIEVVEDEPVVDVEGIVFNMQMMNLLVGGANSLIATLNPDTANKDSIIWTTSNKDVAEVVPMYDPTATTTVDAVTTASVTNDGETEVVDLADNQISAIIEGLSPGTAVITAETYDGTVTASCLVTVTLDPATDTSEVFILGTNPDSIDKVDEFASKEDVFIRGFNLQPDVEYFVKVEEKGSKTPLGEGTITFKSSDFKDSQVLFNLYELIKFEDGCKNSKGHFVSMSTYEDFPKGDEEDGTPKTLTTNFKIGSPIPTGSIEVLVKQIVDGDLVIPEELIGADVVLARELDGIPAIDVTIEHYLNPLYQRDDLDIPEYLTTSKYNDEVKMVGKITANGTVSWLPPKEVLKIGGYYLLVELPDNYISNLNSPNPASEDGELLKEVHITRDGEISREVITIEIEADNPDEVTPEPTDSLEVVIKQLVDVDLVDPIDLEGTDVILARELDDIAAVDVTIEDYLNPLYEGVGDLTNSKYTDYVKLIGHIGKGGVVSWDDSKEALKVGEYILLIDLPDNYTSNLNSSNPDSEDGECLKQVNIIRNRKVLRQITAKKIKGNNPDDGDDGTVDNGDDTDDGDDAVVDNGDDTVVDNGDDTDDGDDVIVDNGDDTDDGDDAIVDNGDDTDDGDDAIVDNGDDIDDTDDATVDNNDNKTDSTTEKLPKTGGMPLDIIIAIGAIFIGLGFAIKKKVKGTDL